MLLTYIFPNPCKLDTNTPTLRIYLRVFLSLLKLISIFLLPAVVCVGCTISTLVLSTGIQIVLPIAFYLICLILPSSWLNSDES